MSAPNPIQQYGNALTRRHFFGQSAFGLGSAALASILPSSILAPRSAFGNSVASGGMPDLPHFAPRAKRAIYLHMNGGPSQMDLFDYKPKMNEMFDADLPESIRKGQRLTTMTSGQTRFPLAPSKYKFQQYGQHGAWISELLPYTSRMADDLAIVKTVWTEAINHDPAVTYICTGNQLPGKASLGSWLSYGLGTMNANLPAFVVMTPSWSSKTDAQAIYNRLWGSGYLPTQYQGVALRSQGDPVLFLSNPPGVDTATRRRTLDRIARFNHRTLAEIGDPETQTRIDQYEMAFRMQTSVPELTNLADEPKHILDMYGPDVLKPGTFAASCLLGAPIGGTRRPLRADFSPWLGPTRQHRRRPPAPMPGRRPSGLVLVQDLKQRGLLEDTLVIWGGEFGRTIYCQGELTRENYGRDHHPRCFTMWMTGGGIRPGIVYGETDDFSYNIVDKPVHIHDLNATILHTLGIDNSRLTFRAQGLDQRLTGVEEHHAVTGLLG